MKPEYLRSRQRRGRWFHTYRREGREISLGVHGLHPTDKRVFAAYCAQHSQWEPKSPESAVGKSGTFAWGLDLYAASDHWSGLAEGTRGYRSAILARYREAQGDRPLHTITREALMSALSVKRGFAGRNEFKALAPVFAFLHKIGAMPTNIASGIKIDAPRIKGHATATADEIEAFMRMWPRGTVQRLTFDLAYLTGAARVDLVKLSRRNIGEGIISYTRQKTGVAAQIPVTPELKAAIAHLPEIAPAFILTQSGRPRTANGLGTFFADAAEAAGMKSRLHGLRKAFCVYWAEKGATTHQIAAMAGHSTLSEIEVYTAAADRKKLVRLLIEGA